MTGQRRHESPALGDAVLRMMRALQRRAGEGDTEALEQLQAIDRLASPMLSRGVYLAHRDAGYSLRQIGDALGVSHVAVAKRVTEGMRPGD